MQFCESLEVLCIRFTRSVILVSLVYMETVNVEEKQTLGLRNPGALFPPIPYLGSATGPIGE